MNRSGFEEPLVINRRDFIHAVSLGVGSAFLGRVSQADTAVDQSHIDILLGEPIGVISPDMYGCLVENLGTQIYDGVWVGEKSKVPNIGGIRKSLIEHLRLINASVFRWPGGNFADYYDWRDGVGLRAARPRRTNPWSDETPKDAPAGPQRYDPNQFGTHEFMALCQLTGGRPFLNLNIRGMTPMDAAQWVDYCNAPEGSTSLADLRKKNGSAKPFGVDYWGIGNEPWSWGGNMSASDYAGFYRRFVEGLPLHGRELKFIACGGPPSLTNADWTRTFLEDCAKAWRPVPLHAMGLHYYTAFPPNYMYPGETIENYYTTQDDRPRTLINALNYNAVQWYSVLSESLKIEGLLKANWEAVREFDKAGTIKLMVDEWGGIFDAEYDLGLEAIHNRSVPLRDALCAGLTLNVLQSYADIIAGANFTGLINQEGGLFRARGDKFVATPIYYVFKMYAPHQGAEALRTIVSAADLTMSQNGQVISITGLSGAASIKGQQITLTVVNPSVSQARETLISLHGGTVQAGRVTTLTHTQINAQNTFDQPDTVHPITEKLEVTGVSFKYAFPPRSVSSVSLQLVS